MFIRSLLLLALFPALFACKQLEPYLATSGDPQEVKVATTDQSATSGIEDKIVGMWELIPYPEHVRKKLNKVEPWPLPLQYFVIDPDGRINWMMATGERGHVTRIQLRNAMNYLPWNRYNFENGFMVISYPRLPNRRERWGINLITAPFMKEGVEHRRGDLLMSLDDGRGNPIYWRHLRQMPK